MTRATRGHAGYPLTAPARTVAIYALVAAAALAASSPRSPPTAVVALTVAESFAWVAAFGLFALLYAPMLVMRRTGR
ncbi:MAG: NnrS family protein [Burkholderiaceae bacterium]